jgi:integrase
MAKQTDRYEIREGLYIYRQDNSKYWYARFVIDGVWYAKATKKTNRDDAAHRASELFAEYRLKVENDIPIARTKRAKKYLFPTVADLAIDRMNAELNDGVGKSVYEGYILALNKYHKEFFASTAIMNIDGNSLREFDNWRREKLGRVPAKSTVQTHNAALMRVFDEAVIRKYLVPSQVPIPKTTGMAAERRASFSEEEFKRLVDQAYGFEKTARTKKSQMIRELLIDYMVVAANTGIRPGVEMEHIRWSDISIRREDEQMALYITVRKGKTTTYTGTRKVVCRDAALLAFLNLRDRFPNRRPEDRVFVLADGTSTKQLGKSFTQLLKSSGMETSSEGKRSLYSLRHSYITWQLKRKVPAQVLAVQCGTSVQMLDRFYSHVVPEMFTGELSGIEFSDAENKLKKRLDPEIDQEAIDATNQFIDEWEAELAKRGCI